MTSLYRLLSYARPYRGRLAGALVAMAVYGAGTAGIATLIQLIFDEVLPAQKNLQPISIAVLALYFFKGLGAYLSSYLMADVGQRVVHDLRNELFRHMLGQSAAFFSLQTTGRLMSRITNDVAQLQRVVSETIGDLARETLSLVFFTGVLIFYDARLALVCFTGAPIILYPLVRLGQRVRRTSRRSQEALEQLSHVSAEAFTGHRIVKAFGAEAREAAKFHQASHRFYRTSMRVTSVLSMLPPLMELVGGIALVLALWYGSSEISSGRLTTGEFVAFITTLFLMYGPARKLSRVNADLQQAAAAADRVFETLDTHSEVRDRADATAMAAILEGDRVLRRPLLLRGCRCRDLERCVLPDSLRPDVGDRRAKRRRQDDAGEPGAAVLRSHRGRHPHRRRGHPPDHAGVAAIPDRHRDPGNRALRRHRGRQYRVWTPHATRAEIEAAARAAHAHEFIAAIDEGYDTTIGERGQRLSGGQRQRLAIARAILRDSPILILDEATSALDAESEALVQDALSTLMLNRTSFVIAHRLSTVRRADVIVVLERGGSSRLGRTRNCSRVAPPMRNSTNCSCRKSR